MIDTVNHLRLLEMSISVADTVLVVAVHHRINEVSAAHVANCTVYAINLSAFTIAGLGRSLVSVLVYGEKVIAELTVSRVYPGIPEKAVLTAINSKFLIPLYTRISVTVNVCTDIIDVIFTV